jgi:hypothetical protein
MNLGSSSLPLSLKSIIAFAVAAGILAAVFVPFQKVEAFNVGLDLPNSSGGHVTQTAGGETFTITVNVEGGEFISVSSVDVILDNGQSSVTHSTFASTGALTSGPLGVFKNNEITITPTASQTGYGYGYGSIASGILNSGNSYSIVGGTTGFISGNNVGFNNQVTNATQVVGLVGPGTITIQANLNTALLSVGPHTIDVIIDTGSGGNGVDKLTAPQLSFNVDANSQVTSASITSGSNTSTSTAAPGGGTITIEFDNVSTGGQVAIEEKSASSLDADTPSIFDVVGSFSAAFTVGSSTANTAGTIYEIDVSAIAHTGFIYVTIPYDPNVLPSGVSESDVKFYHWTGTAWEDVTISVDTSANTVTGRLITLSPVVAGYTTSATPSTSTTTTTSGGGGSGGPGSVIINQVLPSSYFDSNPLAKLQIKDSTFKTLGGALVFGGKVGQQVNIAATFHNYQDVAQNYAMIVQVIDKDGFTTDLGWVTGTVDAGKDVDGSRSWTIGAAGDYTVKIYVWNGVSGAPIPLSEVTAKSFSAAA